MGVSTDAILFYGYNLPSEEPLPEAADEYYDGMENGKGEVSIGRHCHSEYPVYYIYWTESEITAARGYAKPVSPVAIVDTAMADLGGVATSKIIEFAGKYGIQLPETGDEDYERSSAIGWWLASYWDG